jgi:RND family efflux transporter MFP subunit
MKSLVFVALLLAVPAFADQPLLVEVVKVYPTQDARTLVAVGEIRARDTLSPSFATGGRIAEVLVEEGDSVDVGGVLARMDAVQQTQALRVAEAGLAKAQANYTQAERDLERQVALLARGAATRIARDAAEDALNISSGALTQAMSELSTAQKDLEDTVLRSSASATVIDRMAEPGQVVGAAQQILELAIGTEMDAVFQLPEAILTHQDATEVSLTLLDRPDEAFAGDLREVSPLIDPRTGTVTVTVSVRDAPRGMTYGDAVRGAAKTAPSENIILPAGALTAYQKGAGVWVVDPATKTVSIRPITLDRFETGTLIVRDGVAEGEIVVSKGTQLLYPGRAVTYAEVAQ